MNALAWGLPAAWLVTFALHSTVLLLGAWAVSRFGRRLTDAGREMAWRVAAFGAVVTATLQTLFVNEPLGGHLAAVDGEIARGAAADPGGDAVEPILLPVLDAPALASAPDAASPPWLGLLMGGAVLLGLLLMLRLCLQRVRLAKLLTGRRALVDARLWACVESWRRAAGMRRVRLSTSDALTGPVAFGILRPEICLPTRAGDLDPDQRLAVVAHELAHLRRGDPFWLGVSAVLRALFWWQPLHRVAHTKLQELAEFRSDALALQWTDRGPLAGALVEVAAWLPPAHALPVGLPAMAARPSVLRSRVERILVGHGGDGADRPVLSLCAAALVLAGLAAALPGARWQSDSSVPVEAVGEADAATPGADSPMQELMSAFDAERKLLAGEIHALRADLAALPPDHEIRALMDRLEERVARMDRTREALGALLAVRQEHDREREPRSRGER